MNVNARPLLKKLGWVQKGQIGYNSERWFRPGDRSLGCSYNYAVKTLKRRGLLDPDENLREQKEIAQRFVDGKMTTQEDFETDSLRLAELVVALDEWLSRGGFPPKAWKKSGT